MALLNKLPASAASQPPALDGVDRILLAQAAQLADAGSVRRVAVVDALGPLIFDELARSFPNATFAAYNDSFVDAHAIDSGLLEVGHSAAEHDGVAGVNEGSGSAVTRVAVTRVAATESERFPQDLFEGADLVLVRLPKSLDALEEFAFSAARALSEAKSPDAPRVILAARTKYMTHSQTDVLAKYFTTVTASLGQFKSRALIASSPRADLPSTSPFPRTAQLPELGITLSAHGGVFAGTKLDIGTRALVENLGHLLAGVPHARDFVDAGCGTGVLSAVLAGKVPDARIMAVDVSAAAMLSTRATARDNGYGERITAVQDDALRGLPTASADVVVCNPPFHTGAALDTDVARTMFEQAGRVLRAGGELWTVFNSPLPYLSALRRAVGPTQVVSQNRKFTVTVSTKR